MFASIELKAIILALAMGGAAITAGVLTHKVDSAAYAKLELSYAQAQAAAEAAATAEQKRLDDIATSAAKREAATQAARASLAQRQLKDLQSNVKVRLGDCFRYDFIRLLDARIHGVLTERLPLPTGKSADACAPFDAPTLAGAIGGIVDQYRTVAEQHNALIDFYRSAKK